MSMAYLLFIRLVGTPLVQFKPDTYARSWLAYDHHSANDVNSKTHLDHDDDSEYNDLWALL